MLLDSAIGGLAAIERRACALAVVSQAFARTNAWQPNQYCAETNDAMTPEKGSWRFYLRD